jgi:hypothetical protein
MRTTLPFIAGALAALGVTLVPSAAAAQPSPRGSPAAPAGASVEGAVLAIQGEDLVVDLGAARGAVDGAVVEIWRPLKLKHPVSGKVLTDRFRIGALELTQVQKTMALARATAPLSRPAEVGDVVVLAAAPSHAPSPGVGPASPPAPSAEEHTGEKPPEDPEARAVSELFDALKGADLWSRVRRYEEYVKAHPTGRYARTLGEEAAALRELIGVRDRAAEQALPRLVSFSPPREALAGSPLRIAVELDGRAAGAVLHVRRRGVPGYQSLPMTPIGNAFFAVVLPEDVVLGPMLEYFIEAIAPSGTAGAVEGTADSPRELEVFEPPRPYAPRKLPSHVEISTDYADYNRLRHNDYAWQTEGWFGVRYGDTGVRALRTGFGVYRGVGGSVNDLDVQGLPPRSVGLTYGWLESEFGFHHLFSVGTRAIVGLVDAGVSGGGQVMIRIGNDLGTNLVLGGEILGALGVRGIAQLELNTFARVPIVLRTEVTNQPAGFAPTAPTAGGAATSTSDIGGRGIVQVGYRFTPDFLVALRGSFQGRTIQHAGPGFGGAVGYSW